MTPDPDLQSFVDAVSVLFDAGRPESFWQCDAPLRQLLASGAVRRAVDEELRRLIRSAYYLGDWQPRQLTLHRADHWSVSVALLDRPRQYVHTSPYLAYFAPIGRQALAYDLYELPAVYRNDVFDPSVRLQRAGTGRAAPGELLSIQSQQYAYDFLIDEPVLVVKLQTAPYQPLEWLFNKETLYAWQANDSDVRATQMRVAAYLLGKMAHPSSAEPLELLTTHPHHAVRWAAIQNLGRLSRKQAIAKLNEALQDPHPHIRRAAQKTLQQLTRPVSE